MEYGDWLASAFERDSQSKMVFHLYLYHHYSLMTLACPVCAFVCVSEWVMGRSSHSHWTRAIRNDSHEFSYFVDLVALRCEHTLAHEMRIAFQWPAKCKCARAHTHTLSYWASGASGILAFPGRRQCGIFSTDVIYIELMAITSLKSMADEFAPDRPDGITRNYLLYLALEMHDQQMHSKGIGRKKATTAQPRWKTCINLVGGQSLNNFMHRSAALSGEDCDCAHRFAIVSWAWIARLVHISHIDGLMNWRRMPNFVDSIA